MSQSVLVVDDDAAFRDLVRRILKSSGYDVVGEASTVGEGLDLAVRLRPDTVLADIGLPDGDGFALTRLLVKLPWPVRVVLISADSDAVNRSLAIDAGATGFLAKTKIDADTVRCLIERR